MMCTIIVSLLLQISTERPSIAKQYSYVSEKKAQEFADYYREQMKKYDTPPRILDVQLVKTHEFNCANFTKGME
jgi:hypothetical protein